LTAAAQADSEPKTRAFSFYFDNDLFYGTDRCYTGGGKIVWRTGDIKDIKSKPLLRWMPFVKKPDFSHHLSFSVAENIFTPDDIERGDIILDDRPFAGHLYLGMGIHSTGIRRMDTIEFNLGIVGPHSYAEDIQRFVHTIMNARDPRGWKNQLKDELTLQLLFNRKWKLLSTENPHGFGFDLIPHCGGGFGNVYIYSNAGVQARIGWNIPDGFGTLIIRPGSDANIGFVNRNPNGPQGKKFGFHIFTVLDGQAVLRNIFLDGNTFKDSHSIEKKNFIADIMAGFGVKFGSLSISYAYVFWTKLFDNESQNHIFGSVNISFTY
jgi:hypothetical protein